MRYERWIREHRAQMSAIAHNRERGRWLQAPGEAVYRGGPASVVAPEPVPEPAPVPSEPPGPVIVPEPEPVPHEQPGPVIVPEPQPPTE